MVTKIEKRGAGIHIVSEATGHRSREEITVLTGENLLAGTVLGVITASGKYVQQDLAAIDGSEVAVGVLWDDTFADAADAGAVVHVRDAEVLGAELVYSSVIPAEIDQINAELLTLGIVVR